MELDLLGGAVGPLSVSESFGSGAGSGTAEPEPEPDTGPCGVVMVQYAFPMFSFWEPEDEPLLHEGYVPRPIYCYIFAMCLDMCRDI